MSEHEPIASETIGGYHIRERLGEGGMGTVYLAEHALLGRRAAIKVLHARYSQEAEIVERFFNEARAATSIADPGIVQIFDFGYHDKIAFLVMELLHGEALDARLDRLGRLPVADVLRLSRQLALSLHAAHQRGVIHRDLKPDNIFIVPDAEVAGGERTKILDFGIAKLVDDESHHARTQTGVMMGTPVYMSPEQCRGAGSLDHRADVYSLGCVMFHLLTGRPPFVAEGTGDLIVAHMQEMPARVGVAPDVDAIVARCLAKRPDDRFATMRDLAIALDAAMRNTTLPTGYLTPIPAATTIRAVAETIVDPRRRRRWPAIAIGVGLATAGIVAVLATRGGDTAEPTASVPAATPVAPTAAPQPAPPAPVASPAIAPPVVVPSPPPVMSQRPTPAPRHPPSKPVAHPPPPPTGSARPPVDPYSDR